MADTTTCLDDGPVYLDDVHHDHFDFFSIATSDWRDDYIGFDFTTPVTTSLSSTDSGDQDSTLIDLTTLATTPEDVCPCSDPPLPDSLVTSTTFHPAFTFQSLLPDSIFLSSDAVYFFVHRAQLSNSSCNNFGSLFSKTSFTPQSISNSPVIFVSEDAVVLDVVLHAVYDMPLTSHNPSLPTLLKSIQSFQTYGIPLHDVLSPSSRLCQLILAEAPRAPLEVYAVVALHHLDHLAIAISAKLHSIVLADIPDSAAVAMGPIYMKRLFLLHHRRTEYLKSLLKDAPETHADTIQCGFVEQKNLQTAWALASGSLLWDARPGEHSSRRTPRCRALV